MNLRSELFAFVPHLISTPPALGSRRCRLTRHLVLGTLLRFVVLDHEHRQFLLDAHQQVRFPVPVMAP